MTPDLSLNASSNPNGLYQIFQIDLMVNPCSWRNNCGSFECWLSPTQEGVAFSVAFKFYIDVFLEGILVQMRPPWPRWWPITAVRGWFFWCCRPMSHGFMHSSQINNGRNTCEILHQHRPCWAVSDFLRGGLFSAIPFRIRYVLELSGHLQSAVGFQTKLSMKKKKNGSFDRSLIFTWALKKIIVGFSFDCQCFTGLKCIVAGACHIGTSRGCDVRCWIQLECLMQ